MAQRTKPEQKKELWQNTVEALKNNSFVDNMTKTLNKLEQPLSRIERIEFWGQEPTLTLPYVTENWDYWMKTFPSLRYVFFSTNGMTNSDIIYDFLIKLDEEAVNPIHAEVQISYDGIYGEEEVRGGDSNFILENFIKLQKRLNEYQFTNLKQITFNTHAVLSNSLIEQLDDVYKVENFFKEYECFTEKIQNAGTNKIIHWVPPCFLAQNCFSATVLDGVRFENFLRNVNLVKAKNKYHHTLNIMSAFDDFAIPMLGYGADDVTKRVLTHGYETFDDFVNEFFDPRSNHPYHTDAITCSASRGDLKIMYDGTILMCQNLMFDTYLSKDLLDDSVNNWGRYYLMQNNGQFNPINATEDEINQYAEYMDMIQSPDRVPFTFQANFNLMYMLAKSGQIDNSYLLDLNKIKKHAFLMSRIGSCPYNCQVMSGSVFTRNIGELRQYCNGVLDRVEKTINLYIKYIREGGTFSRHESRKYSSRG